MAYLLDTNIFIQAKNLHYGMDFCPAFWDWVAKSNSKKNLFSIEKVSDELKALTEVSRWVNKQDYEEAGKNVFLQGADYYLIAQAKAKNYTIVTHETPSDSKKKIKIPNVCIGLQIKCMNVYEMLRKERARFVLQS